MRLNKKEGEIIYHQGQSALDAFRVERGKVITTYYKLNGRALITGIYKKGNYFGLTATLDSEVLEYPEEAITLTDVVLEKFDSERLTSLMETNHLSRELINDLVKVVNMNLQRMDMVNGDSYYKILKFLVLYGEEVNFNQKQIADTVFLSREQTNRVLKQIAKKGIIKLKDGKVRFDRNVLFNYIKKEGDKSNA